MRFTSILFLFVFTMRLSFLALPERLVSERLYGASKAENAVTINLESNRFESGVMTCVDGIQNGDETGIDCGGPDCAPCACVHPDFDALMALYASTNGAGWTENSGWAAGAAGTNCDPCGWYGIGCDGDGRVTCIDLDGASNPCQNGNNGGGNNLFGSLPDLDLPFLTTLSLSWNNLFGPLPDFQGVPNLVTIHFWNNNFSGIIPDFSNLPNLENLTLGWNNFSGRIPDFSNLSTLRTLSVQRLPNLDNNALPDFSSIPNLTSLSFRENNQSGEFPVFTGLANLEILVAWGNSYTGDLPLLSDNHPNLTLLSLQDNSFSGEIPADYADLTGLVNLQLQNNNLEGCIPAELTNLCTQLVIGDISNNASLDNDSWEDFCNLSSGQCTCVHPDYDALIELYTATNGAEWANNNGWVDGAESTDCNPCSWQGIDCAGDRVVSINLEGNNLQGTLPDPQFPFLTNLQLGDNNLAGQIPDFTGIPELRTLQLEQNQLTGSIPDFSNLPELLVLYCHENLLTGSIPDFTGIPEIDELNCRDNQLVGSIPPFSIANSLIVFAGDSNQLTGVLPDFNSLPDLLAFSCANNQIEGDISDLTVLFNVNYFDVSRNQLEGCYPSGFCDSDFFFFDENPKLPSSGFKEPFCLGASQVGAVCDDGDAGTENDTIDGDCNCVGQLLPTCDDGIQNGDETGVDCGGVDCAPCACAHPDYDALMALYTSTNGAGWDNNDGWVEGAAGTSCDPCNFSGGTWFGINCDGAGRVTCIDLDGNWDCISNPGNAGNGLTGTLPDIFDQLTEVTFLELSHNRAIGGEIPVSIGQMAELTYLDLGANLFTGSIPPELGGLTNLTTLSLGFNQLSGEIPSELGQLNSLQSFSAGSNQLEGSIPSSLGNMLSLRALNLDGNDLSGVLPTSLGNLTSLTVLGLSRNNFSGEIPSSYASLVQMSAFRYSDNNISGSIPTFIEGWIRLRTLRLNNNNVSGELPEFLGNLPEFNYLNASENDLQGPIPLSYINQLWIYFEVNDNQLSGAIPEGLGSAGDDMREIFLHNNQLSGCVPMSFGDFCSSGTDVNMGGNLALPYEGNFDEWCMSNISIGTPCNDSDAGTTGETIQPDCSCGLQVDPCGTNDAEDPTIICPDDFVMTCTEAITRGYDQDLTVLQPADITTLTGTPIIDDDCPAEDLTLNFQFISDNRDECGEGTAELEFTVTDAGGNSAVCVQEIQFQAVGPTVFLDSQNDIYCGTDNNCTALLSYSFSTERGCDPEPPVVNVQLDIDAIDSNGDGAYTLEDFTATNDVTAFVTDDGTGRFTVVLVNLPVGDHALRIIAADACGNQTPVLYQFTVDAAPVITLSSQDDVYCDDTNSCTTDVLYEFTVGQDCDLTPPNVTFQLDLDATDSNGDGDYTLADFTPVNPAATGVGVSITNNGSDIYTISATNLPLGNHAMLIAAVDDCGNEAPTLYVFEVEDCIVDAPICEVNRTVNLADDGAGDGTSLLITSDLIINLPTDCSNANKLSIYAPDVYNQTGFMPGFGTIFGYEFDCSHLGENLMRVYVMDDFGNFNFCTVDVSVTDDDSVCPINQPTCTDGQQNGQETGVDCGGPDCLPCTIPCTDVTFNQSISVFNLFTGPGNSCTGDQIEVSVTLVATANPPYVVTVREPDGTLVNLDYNDEAAVQYFPVATASGNYEIIRVEDAEGCFTDDVESFFFPVDQPLSVPELGCGLATQNLITVEWVEDPNVNFYEISYDGGPVEVVDGGSFTLADLDPDQSVSFLLTAYPFGNCNAVETEIACTTEPDPCAGQEPSAFPPTTTLCAFDGILNLTLLDVEITGGNANASVRWYRDAAAAELIADPTFYAPAAAPENLYAVVVQVTNATCLSEVTAVTVAYEDALPPTIPPTPASLCADAGNYTLPLPTDGTTGTWTLIGEGGVGLFNPADFPGETLTIIFDADPVFCAAAVIREIFIEPAVTPDFSNLNTNTCTDNLTYNLPQEDENGVPGSWSLEPDGSQPVASELDISGSGGETLTYFFRADTGCGEAFELNLMVGESIVADFTLPVDTICIDSILRPVYSGADAGAGEFLWSSVPAPVAPAGNTDAPALSWASEGNVELTLAVNNGGCVSEPFTRSVYVKPCANCTRFIDCEPQTGQSVSLSIPDVSARANLQICLPVMPSDFSTVVDIGFTLGWDPQLLAFQRIQNLNPLLGTMAVTTAPYEVDLPGIYTGSALVSGEIPVYWSSFASGEDCTDAPPLTLPDNTPLFEVCFLPANLTGQATTTVSFTYGPQVATVNKPSTCSAVNDANLAGFGAEINILPLLTAGCDPQRDSLALVEIYNTTGGPNWSDQDNWLTPAPIADWEGVFVNTEGCVTILDLDGVPDGSDTNEPGGINMVGQLPNALGALKELDSLYLTDNFEVGGGLPDSLYTLPHLYLLFIENMDLTEPLSPAINQMDSLIVFVAEYNQWTIADLLPAERIFLEILARDGAVALQPQDSIFNDTTVILNAGENLNFDLNFEVNGENNTYSWYRDDLRELQFTGGSGVLFIPDVEDADEGTYYARISHPGVPGLELYTRGIELVVISATCDDGVMNGDETGIDCGGSCPSCNLCPDLTAVVPFRDTTVCPGINLGYEIRATGGQPPYSVTYTTAFDGEVDTLTNAGQGGFRVVAGDYTVEILSVTDADGCSALPENLPPVATATAALDPGATRFDTCFSTGPGLLTIRWEANPVAATYVLSVRTANNTIDTILPATVLDFPLEAIEVGENVQFSVTAVSELNCGGLLSRMSCIAPQFPCDLDYDILNLINPACGVTDGGVLRLQAVGGTPPYTFDFSSDVDVSEAFIDNTEDTWTATNLSAGSYSLLFMDANDCTVEFTTDFIDTPVLLRCNDNVRDTVPSDVDTLRLEIPAPFTAGCPLGAMTWEITGATASTGNGAVGVTTFNVGTSLVTYTIGLQSCSFEVQIDQLGGPDCSVFGLRNPAVVQPTCGDNDGSIAFDLRGFEGNYDFSWSSGDTLLNPTGLVAGIYVLRIEDEATACRFSLGFQLQQDSPATLACSATAASNPLRADGSLSLAIGAAAYPLTVTYVGPLSGNIEVAEVGEGSANIGGLLPGNYELLLTDADGCQATCSAFISAPDCGTIIFGPTLDTVICTGEIFSWRNNDYSEAGTYRDTVTTAADCDSLVILNLSLNQEVPRFTFCPPDLEVLLNLGNQTSLDLGWEPPVASASCGEIFDFSDRSSVTGLTRDTTITYSATATNGLAATCSFDITVIRTDTMTFYVDAPNLRRTGSDTVMVPVGVVNFDQGAAFQLHLSISDENGTGAFLEGLRPLSDLLASGLDAEIVDPHTLNLVWSTSNPQPNTFPDSTLLFEVPVMLSGEPGACIRVDFVETLPEVAMAFRLGEEVFPTTVGGEICLPALADIGGTIQRLNVDLERIPVPNVEISLYEDDLISRQTTGPDGNYFYGQRPREQPYTIEPFLDGDDLNGVSILDVVLIRNMITGRINLSSPTSPYQYIAADLQGEDCRIGISDLLVELRTLSGALPSFPTVNSYRFVDARHPLPTVEEIRAGNETWCFFPETITLDPLQEDSLNNDFIAVKMGDVSLNARDPRPIGGRSIGFTDRALNAGDTIVVDLLMPADLVAADLHWRIDPTVLRPVTLSSVRKQGIDPAGLVNWSGNSLTQVWSDLTGPAQLTFVATTSGRLSDHMTLGNQSFGADELGNLYQLNISVGRYGDVPGLVISASPNPFRNELDISTVTNVRGSATLTVFDVTSRHLLHQPLLLEAGAQTTTLSTADWPSGIYHLRVSAPAGERWLRLIKH